MKRIFLISSTPNLNGKVMTFVYLFQEILNLVNKMSKCILRGAFISYLKASFYLM